MRKSLISLLMLLMLMPGLACGPFMDAGKAHAAQPMQGMENCPGMDGSQKTPDHEGKVFFKDCMKNDLSGVDHTVLKTPDLGDKVLVAIETATIPDFGFAPPNAQTIRGPPPDWPAFSQIQPSILLTTRRLRI